MERFARAALALLAAAAPASAGYPTGPDPWTKDPLWRTSLLWLVILFSILWGVTVIVIGVYAVLRANTQRASAGTSGNPSKRATQADPDGLEVELLDGDEMQAFRRGSFIMHPEGEVDMSPKAGGTPASPRPTLVHIERPAGLQQAYTESPLGRACIYLIWATSVSLFLAYVIVLVDYYINCQFDDWPDNVCFYGDYRIFGDYDRNSQVFFGIWCVSLAWFFVVTLKAMQLRNFFRTKCRFDAADFIEVNFPEEEEVLSPNPGPFVRHFRTLRAAVKRCTGAGDAQRFRSQTLPVCKTATGMRYFSFECERHLFVPAEGGAGDGHFGPAVVKDLQSFADFHAAAGGLNRTAAASLLERIGPNQIPFQVDSLIEALRKEFFTPFYLYQYLIYMIWVWFSNLPMGVPLSMIVVVCGAINVRIKRQNQATIQTATVCDTQLDVLRDGEWQRMHNLELVPGDVIRVEPGCHVPCDAVIIKGAAICNEAALTGESAPVRKTACPNTADAATATSLAKHTLCCGTTVMQCGGGGGSEEVIAVTRRTGAATGKGDLLKLILFPAKMVFKYDEELPVVVAMLGLFSMVVVTISIIFQTQNAAKKTWITIWVGAMFTCSQTLSPLLPVALVVGQVNASQRLKQLGVFCINPARIAISGKVRVFCFDKTGTLTNEELDFLGTCDAQELVGAPKMLVPGTFSTERVSREMLVALATCHAVSGLGTTLVGNQVEVKMFKSTGWHLHEAEGRHPEVSPWASGDRDNVQIVRRFEFDHAAQTMSVLVRMPDGQMVSYTKGSPEKVAGLCKDPPAELLPHARAHALDGCYVLAVAWRQHGPMDDAQAQALGRGDVELAESQTLLGLIMFRNELKPDTAAAIDHLKAGDCRPVMITGDNAQCGYYIARSCRMVTDDAPLFLAEVKQAHGDVTWHRMGAHMLAGHAALGVHEEHQTTEQILALVSRDSEVELAMTGLAYDALCRTGHMEELLLRTRIFARVPPDGKVDIVTRHVRRGLVSAMAGDGGNDCGALRVAHAGIALSDAEASVVAPFTSRTKTITSCVDLLREGRCSLCTSFAGYKFLITYGMIFPVVKLISYWYAAIMSLMAYFMVDVVAVCVLSYAMTLSRPQPRLQPRRPTSSLLGPTVFASTLGLQILNVSFLCGGLGLMGSDPDYVQWPAEQAKGAAAWWELSDNWEATTLFFFFHFMLTTASISYSFGGPFRLPIWTNPILLGSYLILIAFGSLLVLMEPNRVTDAYHLSSRDWNGPNSTNKAWAAWQALGNPPSPGMSESFRFRLWILLLAAVAVGLLWEKVVVTGPVRDYLAARYNQPRIVLKL
eukprot:TRINITY_DN3495_c0_g3_i2.p1 TRINITY_DN3495_c0_g3~~TRINITY_DN3495_c0_g3_i2.p1  ORF type:complete len:1321 (+),score=488.44 TRINITY_DN3495_c0_g3_i2:105-4067(+)